MSKPISPGEPSSAPTPAAEMLADLGLRYMSDATPGITRRRVGKGFTYRAPDGHVLPNDGTKEWIRSLAIPPAWQHVWISPRSATAICWPPAAMPGAASNIAITRAGASLRDEAKFGRMLAFAQALPRIRDGVEAELSKPGLGRAQGAGHRRAPARDDADPRRQRRVRQGQQDLWPDHPAQPARQGRGRASCVSASAANRGKRHAVTLKNRRLAQLIAKMQELPGQELFQYLDEDGGRQPIDSADVNAFLREIAGDDFTAKDFRTWAGTVLGSLGACASSSLRQRGRRQAQHYPGDRAGGEPPRQHAGDLPQELRPSRDRRRLSRRLADRACGGDRDRAARRAGRSASPRRSPC